MDVPHHPTEAPVIALLAGATVALAATAARHRFTRPNPRLLNPAKSPPRRATRRTLPRRTTATILGFVSVALLVGWLAAAAFVAGAIIWPRARPILEIRRHRASVEASVPDAVELLILIIRAGLTPHQAVHAMTTQAPVPTRPGFVEVTRRLQRGEGLADALAGLPATLGPSFLAVADTLAIAERHGTPIGDALTQLSVDVRDQRRRAREAEARKLPVRLSFPLVFCTLPSFVLVAIAPAVLAALSSLGETTW